MKAAFEAVIGSATATARAAVARDVEPILPSARLQVPRAPSKLSLRQVAIDGDTAVVATISLVAPPAPGSVWVFGRTREGWRQEVRLEPAGGGAVPASFGFSVAISGDTIVVGDPPHGALAFVHGRGGWEQQALLQPAPLPEPTPHDIGVAVAISGDRILLGASGFFGEAVGGAAFAFVRSGDSWRQDGVFVKPEDNFYGSGVAISGNVAAVGAVDGADLFIHRAGVWHLRARIDETLGAAGQVALSGTTLVIDSPNIDNSIEVFVPQAGIWVREAEIPRLPSPPFKPTLALDGDTLVVGVSSGAVVYKRSVGAWSQTAELSLPAGAPSAGFGRAVAVSRGTALVASDHPTWIFELPDRR